jgi:Domain of unknown function (DUF5063)
MSEQPGDSGLGEIAADVAVGARHFLDGVAAVAAGESPQTAVPELLIHLASLLHVGSLLGAIGDVVPSQRYEPDTGRDPDADPLRELLAVVLEGLDEYAYVFDPLLPAAPIGGRISDDLADIAVDLQHGLRHYESGAVDEALWWWQFSYLSNWGDHGLCANRALLSIISHQRLDADAEEVLAAEADALLRDEG